MNISDYRRSMNYCTGLCVRPMSKDVAKEPSDLPNFKVVSYNFTQITA